MLDAHTHLNSDQLFPQRRKHLQTFIDQGGTDLVNIGISDNRNQRAIEIKKTATIEQFACNVYATIGVHPCETVFGTLKGNAAIEQEFSVLNDLYAAEKNNISALGECGIDSYHQRDQTIQKHQITIFERQCVLADKWNLPLVIHTRANFQLTYDILKQRTHLPVYFHCRGYNPEEIKIVAETFPNARIGFCGNLTYKKAIPIQESLQTARDIQKSNNGSLRVLFETDAPYLSPVPMRGKMNEPAFVKHIYEYAKTLLQENESALHTAVKENFFSFYKRKKQKEST